MDEEVTDQDRDAGIGVIEVENDEIYAGSPDTIQEVGRIINEDYRIIKKTNPATNIIWYTLFNKRPFGDTYKWKPTETSAHMPNQIIEMSRVVTSLEI